MGSGSATLIKANIDVPSRSLSLCTAIATESPDPVTAAEGSADRHHPPVSVTHQEKLQQFSPEMKLRSRDPRMFFC